MTTFIIYDQIPVLHFSHGSSSHYITYSFTSYCSFPSIFFVSPTVSTAVVFIHVKSIQHHAARTHFRQKEIRQMTTHAHTCTQGLIHTTVKEA